MTNSFIVYYQVGVCGVYTLFVVVNIKSVFDVYFEKDLSLHGYLLMLIVPLLLINSLRNLKVLVPFSFVANAIQLLTIVAVFYYIFKTPLPSLSERPLFGNIKRFPLAFGTTCFSFTSVAVVIAVENNMRTPKNFAGWFGIYNRALFLLITLTVGLGFLGYWKFGEDTHSSIALNFPATDIVMQIVNLLFSFGIFISFGLNGFVPINLLWETYIHKHLTDSLYQLGWEYLLRFLLVTVSVFFAATVPMLGLFMSVFAAVALSHLLFIFPGLLDICTRYPDNYGRFKLHKIRSILFICYGILGLLTGLCTGVWQIYVEFGKMYSK